ncbi:MAG TPA: LpxL/LpxP family Kdo(2)-lipid IV(A) lauroyl/palmitoleoyl acyltransferase [Rhodanobacteraceae bacterium]|nr:LpxL/LpxP family Kdo(2)-lipid IV(A) lauroyl/palmitoleoyl acyltransferase [Rhodanobacteraceae bacterium]
MSAPPFPRKLLAPRHWPAWLGVACIRLLVLLPAVWVIGAGAAFGTLVSPLLRARRHVIARNLELCFPGLDPRQRDALRHAATREMGRMLGEFALGWFASDAKLARLHVEIEGLKHLEATRAQGRGVLLVGGHFAHLELCARLISRRIRIAGMYRRMDSAVFEYMVLRARLRYADTMFDKDQLRASVKYLKRGGTIWYAPDQDMRGKDTVFAPFFGVPASTITATHHLARLSGAAVMPFFHRRTPSGGYVLRLEAPLADFPGDDVVADTARVNAAIERMVREAPAQYLWAHKRFKTRPDGLAQVYGERGAGTGYR